MGVIISSECDSLPNSSGLGLDDPGSTTSSLGGLGPPQASVLVSRWALSTPAEPSGPQDSHREAPGTEPEDTET